MASNQYSCMKKRSILLFCFVVLMVFIGVVNAQDCSITGKWQRTDGHDLYTFYGDGTGQALFDGQTHNCTWVHKSGVYTLNWTEGPGIYFVDTVTMSNDCNSLNGTNTVGTSFNAVRINQPPIAVDDSYRMDQDSVLTIAKPGVLINDSDPDRNNLTALVVSYPVNGDLLFNANGSYTYTPLPEWYGNVTFTYKTSDGVAESTIAQVWITVNKSVKPTEYFINTTIQGSGAIAPQGNVLVPSGSDLSFDIRAGNMSWLTMVTVDTATIGGDDFIGLQNLVVTFKNVTTNHTVSAEFISPPRLPGS
jgi:hypothetical protein